MSIGTAEPSGSYPLGGRAVFRLGYGAMQLAGPRVMGPPADRDEAIAVLTIRSERRERTALASAARADVDRWQRALAPVADATPAAVR